MQQYAMFLALMTLLSITSCNPDGSKADEFDAFVKHFSETARFAYVNVNGHKALLVSHETFGNNGNDDVEAIDATIFALDAKGKIITLGSVRSQGTLYPVSLLDGKLMVAGHQFVRIYSIRGKVPELVLDSFAEGDGPELESWFETFQRGESVKFNKKPK